MTSAVRIAMWSGPRCHSTALMRSFENRADTRVVDEPFFGPYLAATRLEHPVAELVIGDQGGDAAAVAARLAERAREADGVQYEKHMAHHLLDDFPRDWLPEARHAFLIRDPRSVLASYVKKREAIQVEDLGVHRQLELYRHVKETLGQPAPILDARRLLEDPRMALTRLCDALELEFDEAMLEWPAGRRESDGVWAGWWYDKLMRSTRFMPYKPKDVELDDELQAIADAALPAYEELLEISSTL